jgi:RNA polymerase sigma-70 factor (ECF subfamily)
MDEGREPPKARAGSDAIATAFTEFRSALMRLVGRIVSPHYIEDIVQETFIRAYEASRRQTINHPRSFMWKTAKNLALNHIENSNQKLTTNVADFGDPDVSLPTELVEAELELEFESRERFLIFCRAVQRLPLQCRRVFILKKVYGLPQKEIAARLEISESTVEKQAAKGLLVCAEFMEEMGYPVNDGRERRKPDRARVGTAK